MIGCFKMLYFHKLNSEELEVKQNSLHTSVDVKSMDEGADIY